MENRIIKINTGKKTEAVYNLCQQANIYIPKDVYRALFDSYSKETSPKARYALWQILENINLASETKRPICQDTGMVVVFIEVGQNVILEGISLDEAINQGVEKAYKDNYFRKSIVDDSIFERKNTGSNTPAIIHTRLVPGNTVKISVTIKGCGSENMSAAKMLKPSAGVQGIVDFAIETVKNAGANPCPPIRLGIGIGGTLEYATLLSKRALLEPVRSKEALTYLCYTGSKIPNNIDIPVTNRGLIPDYSIQDIQTEIDLWQPQTLNEKIAKLELEILKKVNDLDIGVMGLGGNTTVFGVNILTYPTHIAALPVAVNINCHASRHAHALLTENSINYSFDNFQYEFEEFCELTGSISNIKTTDIQALRKLKAGDRITLSGYIYTGRDAAHKKLNECIGRGEDLPVDIQDKIIYYVGPCPPQKGEIIGPAGPTTSARMDKYTPALMERGLFASIGKGERSTEVINSIKENKGLYFVATGGAACLLSQKITESEVVAYPELGPEAIYRLKIENFPVIVAIDSNGNSIL